MTGQAEPPERIALAAGGVVCALGASVEALYEGLLGGRSGILPAPALDLPTDQTAAPVAHVPKSALARVPAGTDRTLAMVHEAALQIVESPAWQYVEPARLGVCVGTTQGAVLTWSRHQRLLLKDPAHRPPPPFLDDPAVFLARLLNARGPMACPSMACATGTAAIGMALDWIRSGKCDAVVAGGVDALSSIVQAGFASLKALSAAPCRPFDVDREGLSLGEGAALVLLLRCKGRDRQAMVQPGVLVNGWGLSGDAVHLTAPDRSGNGLARAAASALTDAGRRPDDVAYVNAHGTGTEFNDLMEGQALCAVFAHRSSPPPVSGIKGAIGHTMAAAGAIEAVICAQVIERGKIPPTTNLARPDPRIPLDLVLGAPREGDFGCALSTSSGFGGVNAALVLSR